MSTKFPTIAQGSMGLARYLEEIRKFPMLEPDEEFMLAKRWQEHADSEAAAQARHVAPAPRRAHRHGLSRLWPADRRGDFGGQRRPDAGCQALRARQGLPPRHLRHVVDPRLDPGVHPALVEPREDGHHGGAEETVLQSPRAKSQMQALEEGDLPDQVKKIATSFGVTEDDVISMNRRLGGDASLNARCAPAMYITQVSVEPYFIRHVLLS